MTELDNGTGVNLPGLASQGTLIEQTRAVAEVAGAIRVAQECPRSIADAILRMRESCTKIELAKRAFYSYPRGGETVNGATIHLARELMRCFGNTDYGMTELSRAEDHSEMKAWAWDVQTNTRASSTFIAPHFRTAKGVRKPLTDDRDIYESNTNLAARRMREMCFSVLPAWFTEEAKALCAETLAHPPGDKRSLAARITDMVTAFENIGVDRARIETKLGKPADDWTPRDLGQLDVIGASIQRYELKIDEAFPPKPVTVEEIQAQAAANAPTPPAERPDPRDLGVPPTTYSQDPPDTNTGEDEQS